MKALAISAAALAILTCSPAWNASAQQFDGKWTGTAGQWADAYGDRGKGPTGNDQQWHPGNVGLRDWPRRCGQQVVDDYLPIVRHGNWISIQGRVATSSSVGPRLNVPKRLPG